jgi:hypothetical protein
VAVANWHTLADCRPLQWLASPVRLRRCAAWVARPQDDRQAEPDHLPASAVVCPQRRGSTRSTSSCRDAFEKNLRQTLSVLQIRQSSSSSSPYKALSFFRITSKAAASASALSLRRSSFFSARIFFGLRCADASVQQRRLLTLASRPCSRLSTA